ncbi:MAG: hypothetical protein ACQEWM_13215 [Actinomycetota bacterium]
MADSTKMPVLEFTAQMRGRPARVWVFRDRIEWSRRTGPGLLGRSVLAAATEGASEAVESGTADDQTGSLPIDAISSIVPERTGMRVRLTLKTMVTTIEMEVSRAKATKVLEALQSVLSSKPSAGD